MSKQKHTLVEYTREILPLYRELFKRQDLLKNFKETDEKAQELTEIIKEAQANLKNYLEENGESKEMMSNIKNISRDIKEAVKAANSVLNEGNGDEVKAVELAGYFKARAKAEVEKSILKGVLFKDLDDVIGSV
jgi:gas vesicle protein